MCVGLEFGIVEFLQYVFLLNVPVIDRIPGLFFHPASTAITAYGIANRKTGRYYLLAVGLNFTNNFLAVVSPAPFSVLVSGVTVLIAYQLYLSTVRQDARKNDRRRLCRSYGNSNSLKSWDHSRCILISTMNGAEMDQRSVQMWCL